MDDESGDDNRDELTVNEEVNRDMTGEADGIFIQYWCQDSSCRQLYITVVNVKKLQQKFDINSRDDTSKTAKITLLRQKNKA